MKNECIVKCLAACRVLPINNPKLVLADQDIGGLKVAVCLHRVNRGVCRTAGKNLLRQFVSGSRCSAVDRSFGLRFVFRLRQIIKSQDGNEMPTDARLQRVDVVTQFCLLTRILRQPLKATRGSLCDRSDSLLASQSVQGRTDDVLFAKPASRKIGFRESSTR